MGIQPNHTPRDLAYHVMLVIYTLVITQIPKSRYFITIWIRIDTFNGNKSYSSFNFVRPFAKDY